MSEYWKSTPKYWCKHCSVFVRDTKLETANHQATIKHQSNLNRFLRNIHRDNDRTERDRRRAKDEVARLSGSQESTAHGSTQKQVSSSSVTAAPLERQATVEDRMRQMAQLAEMGVAIPDEYRRDLAVVGEWKENPRTDISPGIRADALQPEAYMNSAHELVTKLKPKRQASDDHLDGSLPHKKRAMWGSQIKSYSDTKSSAKDLDIFLGTYDDGSTPKIHTPESETSRIKVELDTSAIPDSEVTTKPTLIGTDEVQPANNDGDVIFKKRRPRHIPK